MHSRVVKRFANTFFLDLTPEKYMGASGKGGPELKCILQKHRLDFKYGVWAKNLASLFISIGYSLPGRAEVSRLAETTPMSKAEQFLSISLHTPRVICCSISVMLKVNIFLCKLKKKITTRIENKHCQPCSTVADMESVTKRLS